MKDFIVQMFTLFWRPPGVAISDESIVQRSLEWALLLMWIVFDDDNSRDELVHNCIT